MPIYQNKLLAMAAFIILAMCIANIHCITIKPIPTISGTGSSSSATTPGIGGHALDPLTDILNTFVQDMNVSSSKKVISFRNIYVNHKPVNATPPLVKVSLNTTTHLLTVPRKVSSLNHLKEPKISPLPLPIMKSSSLPRMKSSSLPRMKISSLPRMKISSLPSMKSSSLPRMKSSPLPRMKSSPRPRMKSSPLHRMKSSPRHRIKSTSDMVMDYMLMSHLMSPEAAEGGGGMMNMMMMQQLMQASGTGNSGMIDPMVMMMLSQKPETPMSPFMKLLMLQNVRGGNKPTSPRNDLFVTKKQINPHAGQNNSMLLSGNSVPANSSGTSQVDLMTHLMRAMGSAEQPVPLHTGKGLTPSSLLGFNSAGKQGMNPMVMMTLMSSPENMENPMMKAMMYMQFGMNPTTAMTIAGVVLPTETQAVPSQAPTSLTKVPAAQINQLTTGIIQLGAHVGPAKSPTKQAIGPPNSPMRPPALPSITRPPSTTPSTANLPIPHNVIPGSSKSGLWPNIMKQGIGPVIPVTPVRIPIAVGQFPNPMHGVSSSTGNIPPLDAMSTMMMSSPQTMDSPIMKAMLYMKFGMDYKTAMMLAGVISASVATSAVGGQPVAAAPL